MRTALIQPLAYGLCLVLLGVGCTTENAACTDCLIADVCYPAGVTNPANPCLLCDPERDATGWSDDDGLACDDGLFCTVQDTCSGGECRGAARDCADGIACNGVESCDEAAGSCRAGPPTCQAPDVCDAASGTCVTTCTGCVIDAVCYGPGQTNPLNVCAKCAPAVSATAWSDNDGQACDDGVFCNGVDTCTAGVCSTSAGDPCGDDGVYCNGAESCNEGTRSCDHAGDPCTAGALCLEASRQCCVPNVAVTSPVCNVDGDVVAMDSCSSQFVVADCADVNGACQDGACACVPHFAGKSCDRCAPGWVGAACDTCVVHVNGAVANDVIHDGSTWDEALTTVQHGVDVAAALGGCEVWAAAGTYTPGTTRDATFQLVSGVSLYGGFNGTEGARAERNVDAYETILSGDIGAAGDNSDNVYHVVTGADGAVLDGFTITGGNASGASPADCGGGMFNNYASPTVTNCSFTANTAIARGGGMYNETAFPTVTNCTFAANTAGSLGGGMHNATASPTVTNCTFTSNSAGAEGGGMANFYSSPTVTNSTLTSNSASTRGGGLTNLMSSSTVTNCILWGNAAPGYPQVYDSRSSVTITYSNVGGGHAGTGNIDADPGFVDAPGDLRLVPTSPCIDAGDNAAAPSLDLDGRARIVDGDNDTVATVDMGAYEYRCGPADGATCAAIKAAAPTAGSGVYWINPGGGCAFPAYCDMNTDGGGWTIVTAITGADGEQPLVSNVRAHGNPLSFAHFNVTRATKMALAALSTESVLVRSNGTWLRMNAPLFDQHLDDTNSHIDIAVSVTASDGATASGYMGYSNFNASNGGDYYVGAGLADHHHTLYYHLNNACVGQYLYSFSNPAADGDAGYDASLALGDWAITNACEAAEGGALVFYAAMR